MTGHHAADKISMPQKEQKININLRKLMCNETYLNSEINLLSAHTAFFFIRSIKILN